jgi:hypothetical protein
MRSLEETPGFRLPTFYVTYNRIISSRSAKKEATDIQADVWKFEVLTAVLLKKQIFYDIFRSVTKQLLQTLTL